jgi:hypothetical protein
MRFKVFVTLVGLKNMVTDIADVWCSAQYLGGEGVNAFVFQFVIQTFEG